MVAKKRGIFKKAGHEIKKGGKKFCRETFRIIDQVVHGTNRTIHQSGISQAIGNGNVGISTSIGADGSGTNIYFQPQNSKNNIGYGIKNNTRNTSVFVNNHGPR